MPGTQVFTYCNLGVEATRGTAVPPTRMFYAGGTGVLTIDRGQNFHESENTGIRTRVRRVTQTTQDVALKMNTSAGVGYDELIIPFSFMNGTATGVGGGADKTWTQTVSNTGTNAPKSYTVDVGDETQNFRCDYVMATDFKISSARGEVTQLEMNAFAQQETKVAKATPATNAQVKIPGGLWTIKFAATLAGLPGASVVQNFLLDWELEVQTGLVWRHYMDGNLYGAQHVETSLAATLTLTVESTAQAITEFYDKAVADTLSFIRLKAIGPVIPTTAVPYSAQIDLPVLYEEPEPISGEEDEVNMYKVVARMAYDPTSAASIAPVIVNTMTALP